MPNGSNNSQIAVRATIGKEKMFTLSSIKKMPHDIKCCNCGDRAALLLKAGEKTKLHLCLECAWTLEDLLDESTAIDFTEAEKCSMTEQRI